MTSKETKPIKAIDDSYEALTNKDRSIRFIKGFGSAVLTMATIIACAGSLNYGVEGARHGYTVAGIIGIVWCVCLIVISLKERNKNNL